MSDDESSSNPPPDDGPEDADPPPVLQGLLGSFQDLPRPSSQSVQALIPALIAAWHAGERAVALSAALRAELESDSALEWPTELSEEFVVTLREFSTSLPSVDDVVPIATDLAELGGQTLDSPGSRQAVSDLIQRLETVAEKLLFRLLQVAFFSPDTANNATRTRNLVQLFERLETLFDRALKTWLDHRSSEVRG